VDFYDDITQADYQQVQRCRAALLEAHHRAVEEYIRRHALDDEDSFPYRGALTGEYYLEGEESYHRHEGSILVGIMARCLGRRPKASNEPRDYLGIDITLKFDAKAGTFSTWYTGQMVI
jgi:hypothetical protein